MLRVARTKKSTYLTTDDQDDQNFTELFSQYGQLIKLIKKHLSSVTASIFAQPMHQDDSDYIEWYSELNGQPEPLGSLSDAQQLKAKKLLSDRLAALSKLADQLPQLEPGSEKLQTLLRKAMQFPGDETVYVINEQPVITFWGIPDPAAKTIKNPPQVSGVQNLTSTSDVSRFRLPKFLSYLGWLLLIVLLASLLWFLFSKYPINWQDYNPFVDEYQILLDKVNAADDDCEILDRIYKEESLIHKDEEKFQRLKKRVESRLEICQAYIQLKNDIELANGDCRKLVTILNQNNYLQDAQGPFIELKNYLKQEVRLCAEYRKLKNRVDAAQEDCPLLAKINSENSYLQQPEGLFILLKQQINDNLQTCNTYQTLKDSINKAQLDCQKLKKIASENSALKRTESKFRELKQQLNKYQKGCKRKQIENIVNLCPGSRPKKLAPELVIVFDASGSMALPADIRKTRLVEQKINQASLGLVITSLTMGKHSAEKQYMNLMRQFSPKNQSRMHGAKTAVNQLVKKTPEDMDIGLVVLNKCPGAKKYGFYPPGKRRQFSELINNLEPKSGTPLGNAINKAGQMIDGVSKPATMIIISDGQESCGANPCETASRLAAQKPYLTINVVDILGTGAGNCVARATKNGKVYTANNLQDIVKMTEEAASTAIPEHCKK